MGQSAFEGSIQRHSFSKIRTHIEIPDLVEVQRLSYEEFLQAETLPDRRDEKGLHARLKAFVPSWTTIIQPFLNFPVMLLELPNMIFGNVLSRG